MRAPRARRAIAASELAKAPLSLRERLTVILFLIGTGITRTGVRPLVQGVTLWIVVASLLLWAIHVGAVAGFEYSQGALKSNLRCAASRRSDGGSGGHCCLRWVQSSA
jgi:hypothetical protein